MDDENARTRNKVKNIRTVAEFEDLIGSAMITEEEREIMRMHYKDGKTLSYISYELGMSEATIKRKHRKILMKIGKLI